MYHEDTKGTKKNVISEDEPFDAVFEQRDIEIDQKPQSLIGKPKVCEKLCLVQRNHLFDSFQLDNNEVFNQKIDSESGVESETIIKNG